MPDQIVGSIPPAPFAVFRQSMSLEHLTGARTYVDQIAREHATHLSRHDYKEWFQELLDIAREQYLELTGQDLSAGQDALVTVAVDEYVSSRWGSR